MRIHIPKIQLNLFRKSFFLLLTIKQFIEVSKYMSKGTSNREIFQDFFSISSTHDIVYCADLKNCLLSLFYSSPPKCIKNLHSIICRPCRFEPAFCHYLEIASKLISAYLSFYTFIKTFYSFPIDFIETIPEMKFDTHLAAKYFVAELRIRMFNQN